MRTIRAQHYIISHSLRPIDPVNGLYLFLEILLNFASWVTTLYRRLRVLSFDICLTWSIVFARRQIDFIRSSWLTGDFWVREWKHRCAKWCPLWKSANLGFVIQGLKSVELQNKAAEGIVLHCEASAAIWGRCSGLWPVLHDGVDHHVSNPVNYPLTTSIPSPLYLVVLYIALVLSTMNHLNICPCILSTVNGRLGNTITG